MSDININQGLTVSTQFDIEEQPTDKKPIAYKFAMLQLQQAELCKVDVEAYMEKIEERETNKKIAAAIREHVDDQLAKFDPDSNIYEVNDEGKIYVHHAIRDTFTESGANYIFIYEFFEKIGVEVPIEKDSNGYYYYKEADVEALKANIDRAMSELESSDNTDMIYLQDAMGQYNSYSAGAAKTISDLFNTNQTISRNF